MRQWRFSRNSRQARTGTWVAAVNRTTLPLFPLSTVLFPEGPLPLRVFEPRYLDMISRCLREAAGFGVVLIVSGSDTGAVETSTVGTVARIVDWYQGSDGILGITARGTRQFRLHDTSRGRWPYVGEGECCRNPRLPLTSSSGHSRTADA